MPLKEGKKNEIILVKLKIFSVVSSEKFKWNRAQNIEALLASTEGRTDSWWIIRYAKN